MVSSYQTKQNHDRHPFTFFLSSNIYMSKILSPCQFCVNWHIFLKMLPKFVPKFLENTIHFQNSTRTKKFFVHVQTKMVSSYQPKQNHDRHPFAFFLSSDIYKSKIFNLCQFCANWHIFLKMITKFVPKFL